MIPILDRNQINQVDNNTIKFEGIKSNDLMERAGTNCYNFIKKQLIKNKSCNIHVFCGIGNNGGDGLVIARKLLMDGYKVNVYKIQFSTNESTDFALNIKKLTDLNFKIASLNKNDTLPRINDNDFVIDAIWGVGLSRPITNFATNIIDYINSTNAFVISIDIPSGLPANPEFENYDSIIKSDITITFEIPKLSFLLPKTGNYVGDLKILPIGLNKKFINKQNSHNYFINQNYVKSKIKKRKRFSHKGDYGHALIIAGSFGKIGAAILSAKACLKSGVGLISTQIPSCGYEIMQKSLPEAMVINDNGKNSIESKIDYSKFSAIGIGPGINIDTKTKDVIINIFKYFNKPIVIDADAINIIANNDELLNIIPSNSILTPHVGEFRRLVGEWKNDLQRQDLLKNLSMKLKSFIILKDAFSSIGCPNGNILYNSTGNPGMSTAGSGDVLTGIITSLLAQGYTQNDSAVIGTYIHGLSGDIAKKEIGEISLTALDLVDKLPIALNQITKSKKIGTL